MPLPGCGWTGQTAREHGRNLAKVFRRIWEGGDGLGSSAFGQPLRGFLGGLDLAIQLCY
jgi:hypothetical protein